MATSTKDQLIRFRCECGKKLKATREIVGKKVKCTKCPKIHRVPESDQLGSKPMTTLQSEGKQAPSTKTSSAKISEKTIAAKKNSTTKSKPTAPKKKKSSAPTANSGQPPAAQDKPLSIAALEQPSLFINDELAAKEPSLLPSSDDSDSRFKLDPKFDPQPSEQLPAPDNSFEFDPADLQLNTHVLPTRDKRSRKTQTQPQAAFDTDDDADHKPASIQSLKSRYQRSVSKTTILASVAVALSLLLLTAISWFVFSDSSLPTEFTERPEVKNYVTKLQEFRKSQRELEIVSEAYVKSKSPTPQEREQIEAFNRSIEPLANENEKLTEALELFQASQVEQARSALIAATETLDQKIPELQARAKDFASKLR